MGSEIALETEPGERLAHVRKLQVSVHLGGHARIGVAEDLLHHRERLAVLEEQRRGGVAQVVEPDVARDGPRPEREAAAWAARRLEVRPDFVEAAGLPAAAVVVALDDAGPAHRPAKHVVHGDVAPVHVAVRAREEQPRRRGADRLLEVAGQLLGDRNERRLAVLGGVGVPRAAHPDGEALPVEVVLAQAEDLPLAHAGVDSGGDDLPPLAVELREHLRHLVEAQVLRQPPRHPPPRDEGDRVVAGPEPDAGLAGEAEHAMRDRPEMVERLRRQRAFLLGKQRVELLGGDLLERQRPQFRSQVLLEEGLHRVGAAPPSVALPPPVDELAEGDARPVGRERLQARGLALCLPLQVLCVAPRLELGATDGALLAPPPPRVLPLHHPDFIPLEDARHGSPPVRGC